jgi:hypothetical protein
MSQSKTKTLQAIRFFNDKISAIELLDVPDGRLKIKQYYGRQITAGERFFDIFEDKEFWSSVVLIALTLFIAGVALWGIRQ